MGQEREYKDQLVTIVSYYYNWGALGKMFEWIIEIITSKAREEDCED